MCIRVSRCPNLSCPVPLLPHDDNPSLAHTTTNAIHPSPLPDASPSSYYYRPRPLRELNAVMIANIDGLTTQDREAFYGVMGTSAATVNDHYNVLGASRAVDAVTRGMARAMARGRVGEGGGEGGDAGGRGIRGEDAAAEGPEEAGPPRSPLKRRRSESPDEEDE